MPSAALTAAGMSVTQSAAARSSQLHLSQQRVEKAVMLWVRKQLARGQFWIVFRRGEDHALGIPLAFHKLLDLQVIFLVKHRTGSVQQFTISAQQLPQRVEHALLLAHELLDVSRAAQPLDVGMTTRYAGCRARYIGQDAIERLTIPPCRRLSGVTACDLRRKSQPSEVAPDPVAARGVLVERE